ncbi:ATP-binding protein [Patescibacteria group bacterium]|nr:ATP-binding protein [Patescibacteria group bacterium]MBU1074710.1 ATP-binding protein [Patescibacteria group bacterium]MBU1952280.1 ATP-binding protein [Patescibacteria group bacterium]
MLLKNVILFAGVINLLLGLIVWKKVTKSKTNFAFSLLGLSTSAWAIFNYLFETFHTKLLLQSAYSFGALVPTIGLFWLLNVGKENYKKKLTWLRVIIIPISLFLFVISYVDGWIVSGEYNNLSNVFEIKIGSLYYVYALCVFILILFLLAISYLLQKNSEGLQRIQLKYISIGIWSFSLIVILVSFILPLFGIIRFAKLDSPSSLLFVTFSAYAIIRHRFMDIRLIIRRTTVYVAATIVVLMLGLLIYWFQANILNSNIPAGILGPIVLLIGIIIFGPLKNYFNQFANKYFFTSIYDYQKTLDKFSSDVTSTINLAEVVGVTIKTIQQTMQIDNIGLFVKNKHYQPIEIFGFDEKELSKMVSNPRCRNFITELRKPIVYDELAGNIRDFKQPQEEIEYTREQMRGMNVAIVLPLVTKENLISCVIMGKKISGDAYTHEDIRLLESLSNQAAISIENARLYNEVEGFNQTLKRKVDDATKRLRELLKIKSDFLTVASHQLRTPTSIVRGMLSLVIEEKDLSSEEREKFISQAYEGINRLERIIHELLNATELEGKKMKLDFKKTRVEDTIEEIVSNLSPLAEQLKVKLAFNKPIRSISKTLADPIKLKEAITNIIDNAIHYSAEGEVEISVRRKQDQIIIEVKDTGIGMSKNDQRMLFTKFSRGEGILQIHPNGTGLGLFIAKKMLEAMGGTITAESKGKGKGSKFTLTIPIK